MPILNATQFGDFAPGAVLYGKFTVTNQTFSPVTFSGTPALQVYKDNSLTQSTSGITLTVDFDSVTGFQHFSIDTSSDGTFYSAGSFFTIMVSAGTAGNLGTTLVGTVVSAFTLNKVSALRPTTAGNTLDVTATGGAGIDWSNVENPTTTLNLSGTSTKAVEPTVAGRTLDVSTTGEAGLDWANIGSPTTTVNLSGTSTKSLQPTTAGRTLDVSATGEAGLDWANIGSPTTTVALTGTTIATTQQVDLNTIKTQAVTCATGVTVLASVGGASAPGTSGGILISGSNAGTTTFGAMTVTGATTHTGNVSMTAGLTITQSTTNADGLSITGNGSGSGISSTGGATGRGALVTGTYGLDLVATTQSALRATGATSGVLFTGGNSSGLICTGGTNGDGMTLTGTGSGVSVRVGQSIFGNLQGNVTGDISGKILGSSATTILGVGARVVDGSGNAVAPAATALTNVTWTDTRAAKLDNLDATITSRQATFTTATGITFPSNFGTLGISASGKINEVVLVDTLTTYTGNTPQTGDAFARIGLNGSGLTSLAPASTALSTANWTTARAGYLDNINVGGPVASQADINALNQSASRTLLLQTVPAYERPETGSVQYTIEARTFNKTTGNPVNADTTPTLTATGNISGNLSGNLSPATNPATGVYQWLYTVNSTATLEQVTMGVSATISSVVYTLNAYTQVGDFVSATFTITDQNNLTAIFNKLPVNNIADETLVLAAVGHPVQTGTTIDANVVSMATNTLTAAALATDAVTEIQTGLATPTNITAGTITNVTNLANAPTSGDFTAAMKNSLNAATPVVTVSGTVVLATSQPNYAPAKASDIPTATINATNDYLYGDKVINTGTVPWEENILVSGTSTILSTKKLRSTAGANITDVTTVIGSATES